MARGGGSFGFAKRQKEIKRQKKKAEKQERRRGGKGGLSDEPTEGGPVAEAAGVPGEVAAADGAPASADPPGPVEPTDDDASGGEAP